MFRLAEEGVKSLYHGFENRRSKSQKKREQEEEEKKKLRWQFKKQRTMDYLRYWVTALNMKQAGKPLIPRPVIYRQLLAENIADNQDEAFSLVEELVREGRLVEDDTSGHISITSSLAHFPMKDDY